MAPGNCWKRKQCVCPSTIVVENITRVAFDPIGQGVSRNSRLTATQYAANRTKCLTQTPPQASYCEQEETRYTPSTS
eukprot:scaffold1710_cov120-Cylindrotheca_fusiformis.AAC.3